MILSDCSQVSFDDSDTRRKEMQRTMEAWVDDLVDEVDDAVSSEQFQEWLDVQCSHPIVSSVFTAISALARHPSLSSVSGSFANSGKSQINSSMRP